MLTYDTYMSKILLLYPNNNYCLNCGKTILDEGFSPFCSATCSHRAYRQEVEGDNMDLKMLCGDCGKKIRLKDDSRGLCDDCLARENK